MHFFVAASGRIFGFYGPEMKFLTPDCFQCAPILQDIRLTEPDAACSLSRVSDGEAGQWEATGVRPAVAAELTDKLMAAEFGSLPIGGAPSQVHTAPWPAL